MIDSGVVILNYNNANQVVECVNDLMNTCIEKIVVVDNKSTDDSLLILNNRLPRNVDLIVTNNNGGYASGNNVGCRYLVDHYECEYVFVSNPDVRVSGETCREMLFFLKKQSNYALVAPKAIENGHELINYWNFPTVWKDIINTSLTFSKFLNVFARDRKISIQNNEFFNVDVVLGAFFLIKAAVLKKVDFFDEETFLYNEENILNYKIRAIGYKSAILTCCYYNHFGGVSNLKDNIIFKYKCYYESMLLFHEKYLKSNKFSILILKIATKIGMLEKMIITKIR